MGCFTCVDIVDEPLNEMCGCDGDVNIPCSIIQTNLI